MKVTSGIVCSLLVLAASSPALAHHSFAAEFDAQHCTDITGTLTKVDYINPHAYLYVDKTGANGKVDHIAFQLSSPSNLRRGGAQLSVWTGNINKTVTVRGCAARNGDPTRFAASYVKVPSGEIHRVGQDVEGVFGTKIWR
jgi:hypothetical protein